MRRVTREITSGNETLLYARETTVGRFLPRLVERFAIPAIQLAFAFPRVATIDDWIDRVSRLPENDEGTGRFVYLSPPCHLSASLELRNDFPSDSRQFDLSANGAIQPRQVADRIVAALCDRIIALSVRRGGQIEQLLDAMLAQNETRAKRIEVVTGGGAIPERMAQRYLNAGAIEVPSRSTEPHASTNSSMGISLKRPIEEPGLAKPGLVAMNAPHPQRRPFDESRWQYLTHCTRAPRGPWPDESPDDFLDELLFSDVVDERTGLSALRRILSHQRIIGSRRAIRGGYNVVSFTAAPLKRLGQLRVFRRHRGRWDFEPYGICIARDWLEERGTKSVTYGLSDQWKDISDGERPFFQIERTQQRPGRNRTHPIDWRVEQEWRHLGDVDLRSLPFDCAVVFVGTEDETERVQDVSAWPVIAISSLGK